MTQKYLSCFMSHSHADKEFADRLCERLRTAGVDTWYSPEDMLPGEKIYEQVRRAIERHDKLLLILSDKSMQSNWVATEIRRARIREAGQGTKLLFPISLVDYPRIRNWELFDSDSGTDLAAEIREYFIEDFTEWQDPMLFERSVQRLVNALAVSDGALESVPQSGMTTWDAKAVMLGLYAGLLTESNDAVSFSRECVDSIRMESERTFSNLSGEFFEKDWPEFLMLAFAGAISSAGKTVPDEDAFDYLVSNMTSPLTEWLHDIASSVDLIRVSPEGIEYDEGLMIEILDALKCEAGAIKSKVDIEPALIRACTQVSRAHLLTKLPSGRAYTYVLGFYLFIIVSSAGHAENLIRVVEKAVENS